MSLIDDIATFIASDTTISSAFGTTITSGANLYISYEPTSPDSCLTIYPYGGTRPALGSKYKYNSSVQVRSRSNSFATAYNTAQAIIDQMHYNGDIVTHGVVLSLQSQPQFLLRDDSRRSILVSNFQILHVKY